MSEIYSKLNTLGDTSIMRKSNELRKEEYKTMKIEEEIRRLEELEKEENFEDYAKERKIEKKFEKKKEKKSSGLFSTAIY